MAASVARMSSASQPGILMVLIPHAPMTLSMRSIWPVAVENLSAGRAKNARKAMECPSSTRRRGWSVMRITGASVAETDSAARPVLPAGLAATIDSGSAAGRRSVTEGERAGLVVSLTGASLVPMIDNFTPAPFAAELEAAGVPTELHGWLGRMGVGALVVKMGIHFVELSPERTVATMPVEGNTQVAGILHGGAHVVLAETLGSFAAGMHAGPGRQALGVDVSATHHRAVSSGTVTGTCTAITLGRTLTTHEIVMTDEQGRRLSTARITDLLRDIPG